MGFKLIRIDANNPYKVTLPLGSHLVGRGRLLDCNDNRVSRNHAELIVTSDSILLKSLHQNPCFVKKKSTSETLIFAQPESQVLTNGDQFGLIPNNYWYEVIYHLQDSPIDSTDVTIMPQNLNGAMEGSETQSYNHDDQDDHDNSQSLLNEVFDEPFNMPQENQSPSTEEAKNELENQPPGNMDTNTTEEQIYSTTEPLEPTNQPVELTNQPVEPINQLIKPSPSSNNTTSSKRPHSEDDSACDIKKVKIEPEESHSKDCKLGNPQTSDESAGSTSNPAVKTEPQSPQESKPSTSNDQAGSSTADANNPPGMPPSPTKPANKPLRERCMYGASCYRRNPQHKAQFSHPADADWGEGARGACPWGAACRRADPRHWRDHDHPRGVTRAPGDRPGMQVFRRNGNNFYINANSVHFYNDHFEVEDSDGDSVDYDYEF